MTTLTPQQMRELADKGEAFLGSDGLGWSDHIRQDVAALRAAADQLEAVQDVVGRMPFSAARQAINAILTVDFTTQEGRDE